MTTICRDYSATRRMPDLGSGDVSPPGPELDTDLLIRRLNGEKSIAPSARDEVDVHTAIVRALGVYLEHLPAENGEPLFKRVTADYPQEGAEGGVYPVAAVWSEDDGVYGGAVGTGGMPQKEVDAGDPNPERATFLQERGEYTADVLCRAYCANKEERARARRLLDRAFTPVTWSGGFALRLPWYFNAAASYTLLRGRMLEDPTLGDGIRVVQFTLRARAPWLRLFAGPRFNPKSTGAIVAAGTLSRS